jgi:hypothetical protein
VAHIKELFLALSAAAKKRDKVNKKEIKFK